MRYWFPIALPIVFLFFSVFLISSSRYFFKYIAFDSSIQGDESVELQQNSIPQDVLAMVNREEKVLGLSSDKPIKPIQSLRVPILMYHYVEYVQDPGDKIRISLNTTPYTLEEEIKTLKNAGYTFMTNSELTDVLDGGKKLPRKPILLTFDDSYSDFYTDAYPILKKYNVKSTQYVIAGFLDRPNHLLTTQLAEIAQNGLVEIAAHTVNHLWLKGLNPDIVQYEVQRSKKILENIIHQPVISFAYPFGAFDLQALNDVRNAGFQSATSTIPCVNQLQSHRYFLCRLRPGGRTGQNLLSWLDQIQDN